MIFLHILNMRVNEGDVVICVKERIGKDKNGAIAIHFKVKEKYKVAKISIPNNKGDSYWICDGSAWMQQFYDGIEAGDYRHLNLCDYFISEKELLNKKLKKIKNA